MHDYENENGKKKSFFFLGSYQLTPWLDSNLLCRKRQKFPQCYMALPSHALLVRVFNVLIFSLQSVVSLWIICFCFIFIRPPGGVSLLMIRVFNSIFFLHFCFQTSLSQTCYFLPTRAWPESTHVTLDDTIYFLFKMKSELCPTNRWMANLLTCSFL